MHIRHRLTNNGPICELNITEKLGRRFSVRRQKIVSQFTTSTRRNGGYCKVTQAAEARDQRVEELEVGASCVSFENLISLIKVLAWPVHLVPPSLSLSFRNSRAALRRVPDAARGRGLAFSPSHSFHQANETFLLTKATPNNFCWRGGDDGSAAGESRI